MERNTGLGAAAGVTLAVVGAVSALFLTIDEPADTTTPPASVEYVDQFGNPLTTPAVLAPPEVIVVNPDGTLEDAQTVDASTSDRADAYADEQEYEAEPEYEEEENYEDHDDEEYEEHDEHDEHDECEEQEEEYEDD